MVAVLLLLLPLLTVAAMLAALLMTVACRDGRRRRLRTKQAVMAALACQHKVKRQQQQLSEGCKVEKRGWRRLSVFGYTHTQHETVAQQHAQQPGPAFQGQTPL